MTLWSRHWAQRPSLPFPQEGQANVVTPFPRRRVPQEEHVSVRRRLWVATDDTGRARPEPHLRLSLAGARATALGRARAGSEAFKTGGPEGTNTGTLMGGAAYPPTDPYVVARAKLTGNVVAETRRGTE